MLSGCNIDLLATQTCPPVSIDLVCLKTSDSLTCDQEDNLTEYGLCNNPLRGDLNARDSTPFFKPCQGLAYTFPSDDAGNSFGFCQEGITCCVGKDCPPHPGQA